MSRHISVEPIQRKQHKEIIEEIQRQAKKAALKAIKQVLEAGLEAEVESQLGRKKGETRRISGQERKVDWGCGHCGCQDANQFLRDGHYRRNLETGWGHIQGLRVPMLECQHCGHDVICAFSMLEKYQRFWIDARTRCALQQRVGAEFALNGSAMERGIQKVMWGCEHSTSGSIKSNH